LVSTTVIFFSIEQTIIRHNIAASRVAIAQNNNITKAGIELTVAKDELQKEEDEFVP
jgi:hypothetical protein